MFADVRYDDKIRVLRAALYMLGNMAATLSTSEVAPASEQVYYHNYINPVKGTNVL